MSKEVKKYDITSSIYIECETEVISADRKNYSIRVIFEPFNEVLESKENITDVKEANKTFSELRDKYKGGGIVWK